MSFKRLAERRVQEDSLAASIHSTFKPEPLPNREAIEWLTIQEMMIAIKQEAKKRSYE